MRRTVSAKGILRAFDQISCLGNFRLEIRVDPIILQRLSVLSFFQDVGFVRGFKPYGFQFAPDRALVPQ